MCREISCGITVALLSGMVSTIQEEAVMKRSLALFVGAFAIVGAGRVSAQEVVPGPPTVEVTVMPAGGVFFMSNESDLQETGSPGGQQCRRRSMIMTVEYSRLSETVLPHPSVELSA
jgi:hypothetical protein